MTPQDALSIADQDAAEAWFLENDPEGVAFEYPVITDQPAADPKG